MAMIFAVLYMSSVDLAFALHRPYHKSPNGVPGSVLRLMSLIDDFIDSFLVKNMIFHYIFIRFVSLSFSRAPLNGPCVECCLYDGLVLVWSGY